MTTINYYQLDQVKACITASRVYLHLPGIEAKQMPAGIHIEIEDLIRLGTPISKEEFETDFPKGDISSSFTKMLYEAELGKLGSPHLKEFQSIEHIEI